MTNFKNIKYLLTTLFIISGCVSNTTAEESNDNFIKNETQNLKLPIIIADTSLNCSQMFYSTQPDVDVSYFSNEISRDLYQKLVNCICQSSELACDSSIICKQNYVTSDYVFSCTQSGHKCSEIFYDCLSDNK